MQPASPNEMYVTMTPKISDLGDSRSTRQHFNNSGLWGWEHGFFSSCTTAICLQYGQIFLQYERNSRLLDSPQRQSISPKGGAREDPGAGQVSQSVQEAGWRRPTAPSQNAAAPLIARALRRAKAPSAWPQVSSLISSPRLPLWSRERHGNCAPR